MIRRWETERGHVVVVGECLARDRAVQDRMILQENFSPDVSIGIQRSRHPGPSVIIRDVLRHPIAQMM